MRATFVKYSLLFAFLNPNITIAGDDGNWKVAKTSQSVKYALNKKDWISVHVGDVVPNGAWVSTGPRGRVQLTRGVESVSFQPDTLASIVTTGTSDSQTDVTQQKGTLDLEFEHRDHPHASVQTPYLAAVVKGTVFRVSVTAKQASVSVTRGLVQVRSFASGQQSNVGPTQSASVSAVAGMTVKGIDVTPQIMSVPRTVSPVQTNSVPSTTKAASATDAPDAKSSLGQNNAGASTSGSRGGGGSSGHGTSGTTGPTSSASGGSDPSSGSTDDNRGDNNADGAKGGPGGNANGKGVGKGTEGIGKGAEGVGNAKNEGGVKSSKDDKGNKSDKANNGSEKDKGNKSNNGNAYGHDDGKGKDKGK